MSTAEYAYQTGANVSGIPTTTNSYTYNNDGYRTAKTVNGTTTDYTLEGDRVLIEKTGSDYVWFYYDAAGAPVAMATGSGPSLYIYRKNLQGDITGIYSGTTGTLLVSYVYDAWGKVTATDVANTTESAEVLTYNPYLYRGYRYDSETGLYYLNSRYYDPEIGRFINADSLLDFNHGNRGTNLFAYAVNNPQSYKDKAGTDAILINDYTIKEGLPFLGHSRLFIQHEFGKWYFTELAGKTMKDAKVYTYRIDESSEKYELLQSLISNECRLMQDYVYIEGDYAESVKYAQKQAESEFGKYNPITNSCVTYARNVLRKGKAKIDKVNNSISNDYALTAGEFVSQIRITTRLKTRNYRFLILHSTF